MNKTIISFKHLSRIPTWIFLGLVVFLLVPTGCSENEKIDPVINDERIETRHWTLIDFTNPIYPCEAAMLTYYVEDCFDGTEFDGVIQSGMEAYNAAPTSINWTEVDNPDDADLVFDCRSEGICGSGAASLPIDLEELYPDMFSQGYFEPNVQNDDFASGGSIGGLIQLTTNWEECPCDDAQLNPCFFQYIVMHEVAHVLGLVHNDIEPVLQDYNFGKHISGTPMGADPTSVINSGGVGEWCEHQNCELNENDILALQSLYPEEDKDLCYCECWEEDYGGDIGEYVRVEMYIDCCDERTCAEIYGGDPLFDCEKKVRDR